MEPESIQREFISLSASMIIERKLKSQIYFLLITLIFHFQGPESSLTSYKPGRKSHCCIICQSKSKAALLDPKVCPTYIGLEKPATTSLL